MFSSCNLEKQWLHQQTIHYIRDYMDCQAQTDQARFFRNAQKAIKQNGKVGMQRMKIDAAPVGVKNGGSQKVVQIDEHPGYHDKECVFPIWVKKNQGYNQG